MSAVTLPPGWALTKLGEIFEFRGGGTPDKTQPNYWDGDIPWASVKDIKGSHLVSTIDKISEAGLRNSASSLAEIGDVIIVSRISPGEVVVSRIRCAVNQDLKVVRPQSGMEPDFIRLLFKTLSPQIRALSSGTTVLGIRLNELSSIPLSLPPLPEQKRIVTKIEELFSELEAGEKSLWLARRQLGVYRQSLLKQAFEGKLTKKWRSQNSDKLESPASLLARIQSERLSYYERELEGWETAMAAWKADEEPSSKPRRPSTPEIIDSLPNEIAGDLAQLPATWFWAKLALMTLGIEYGTGAKSSKTGSCPVIRMGNLQGGEIDWDDLAFTSDEAEIAQYRLASGDVLFNRTNSPEWVGKTAIYRGNRPAVFAGYLMRVNHIPSIVCSGYLNYFLNSGVAREYGNSVKTDGVNQSNINGVKLAGYPFPYCSLPEQQEIVRLLDAQFEAIEQNERELDAASKRSESLRQSILKKAFSGRLVPQDPADEPATALLARIRAERADAPAATRKKRSDRSV